jgi:Mn2+/Fe2+ NRAMP family transporter
VSDAPRFYGVIVFATLVGMGIAVSHINPMHALVATAILNGIVAVPILAATILIASNSGVMGEFAIGRGLRVMGWLTTALMGVAAVTLVRS